MSESNTGNIRELFREKLAVNRAKELSDEVYQTIMDYFNREEYWRGEAAKSHEEVAAEIQNGFESENKMLKNRLRFSVAELNSDKELDAYNEFCDKHLQCRLDSKLHGGMMPYIKQLGTGIGICTSVHCQVCGASKDITDSSVW